MHSKGLNLGNRVVEDKVVPVQLLVTVNNPLYGIIDLIEKYIYSQFR